MDTDHHQDNSAPIPSRQECAAAIMALVQNILDLAPAAGLFVEVKIREAGK